MLCLASASPRRRELLQQIGVPHCAQPADLDESITPGEAPAAYVLRLAVAKASAIYASQACPRDASAMKLPVLGADTSAVIDRQVLGKPKDCAALQAMFAMLSGREHEVLSAVALVTTDGVQSRLSRTLVRFRSVTAAEAASYWLTGEPRDKAGGYAIQGLGGVFVASVTGSYSGVVGLPLFETAELLVASGVQLWQSGA